MLIRIFNRWLWFSVNFLVSVVFLFILIAANSYGVNSEKNNKKISDIEKNENPIEGSCKGMDGLLADIETLDHRIQQKLATIYQGDSCYISEASVPSRPLSDDIVGSITKRWINQALLDQETYFNLYLNKACPESNCSADHNIRLKKTLASADEGVRPYVILENDLQYLSINRVVIEHLRAFAADYENNRFVTEQETIDAIAKVLSTVEGMNDTLLDKYKQQLAPMVKLRHISIIQQRTFNALIAANLMEEADALHMLLDKPIDAERFGDVLSNILLEAEKKKQKVFLEKIKEEFKEKEQEKEKKAEVEEEKNDSEFKNKLNEIVKMSESPKGVLLNIKKLTKKLVSLVKKEKKSIGDPDVKLDAPPEKEVEALMERIFKRKITQHEEKLEKLKTKKGEKYSKEQLIDIDNERFIIDELKTIYANEKKRLNNNVDIRKQNEKNKSEAEKKRQEKAKERKERESQLPNLMIKKTTLLVNNTFLLKPRYHFLPRPFPPYKENQHNQPDGLNDIFPSIDQAVYECAKHLKNHIYPSSYTFNNAIFNMLDKLDLISKNRANGNADKYKGKFNCTLDKAEPEDYFTTSDAAEKLLAIARQPFLDADLSPIELKVSSNCTECSLPMKGTNYGFYPYWQASQLYKDKGLPLSNPVDIDFSVFSRMAYFAIPIANDGSIINELHWQGDANNMRQFVKTLTRYNVDRDIVFYSKNWCHWGDIEGGGKESADVCPNVGEKVTDINISNIIYGYAEKHYKFLVDKHESVKEEGGLSGVTFYFDDYTRDVDVKNIIDYIEHFSRLIDGGDLPPTFEISLMLGVQGLEKETVNVAQKIKTNKPNYFIKLRDLFINKNNDEEIDVDIDNVKSEVEEVVAQGLKGKIKKDKGLKVKRILVFLNESSSQYKKKLRLEIENEFSGSKRVDVLRTVIPIIVREHLGEDSEAHHRQFLDDITYLKYNFGGIGLWNLPFPPFYNNGKQESIADDKEGDIENKKMRLFAHVLKRNFNDNEKNYMNYSTLGPVAEFLYSPLILSIMDVCGEVCPKRVTYTNLFILLLIFNILLEFLWRTNCQARVVIKAIHPSYFVLKIALLLLFFVLLGCHPEWQERWGKIIIVPMILIILYSVYTLFSRVYEKED